MNCRQQRNISPSVASYFPGKPSVPEINPDVHMFTEDVHLGIMPIRVYADEQSTFSAILEGNEQDCVKATQMLNDLGEYNKYDLDEIVCDAIENIAKQISWEGCANYEIIIDGDCIYLNWFTSKNLIKIFSWRLQFIPPRSWDYWNKKYSFINENNIWKVSMPRELGGTKGYKKILNKLGKYSHLGPDFYREDLEQGKQNKYYDFMKYVGSSEIYFNKVTRSWGWNRRDWSQKNCTEYYTFHKKIRFRYAQAILREHILEEINSLFRRLSLNCILKVNGIPSSEEILKIGNSMKEGQINFNEAFDKISI